MAKTKPKPKPEPAELGWQLGVLNFMSVVMTRVGLAGFLTLVVTTILFFWTTSGQKQAIVDTWFLFKGESHWPSTIIVAGLTFLLILQQIHYRRVLKMAQDRIDEVAKEKTKLQDALLEGRKMSTSNTPKLHK